MFDGWPTQACFWLEWGFPDAARHLFQRRFGGLLDRVFLPLVRVPSFRLNLHPPCSLLHSVPASNIPTLNFAKNAKFRMGHPSSKCFLSNFCKINPPGVSSHARPP